VLLEFTLERQGGREPVRFYLERMVNAGYTGRDQQQVRRHIEELAAKGIPGPARTPTLYPVTRHALVVDPGEVEVYGDQTCGEVEYVLLVQPGGRVLVGLGSDHTDRLLEKSDIPRAKQICPNLLSATLWPLEELAGHWDQLRLRSWQEPPEGDELLYQEGSLEALMPPGALLEWVGGRLGGRMAGSLIFSGTLASLAGGFVYGRRFRAELEDPVLGRKLSLDYTVRALAELDS